MKRIPFIFIIAIPMMVVAIWYMVVRIQLSISCREIEEPKQSNIVVLGEGGSMRLAKPEDVDSNDVKLGMIVSTDTISLEVVDSLYTRDNSVVEYIETESMYYNGIKVEVGQKWSCCGDPFNDPVIKIITDIKADYIQFKYPHSDIKNSFHKSIFFPSSSKLLSTKNGYVTRKCEVSNINTSDLYKN
jgi:hypothetical protein